MTRRIPALLGLLTLCVAEVSFAARVPVLRQIDLPHSYYYREMFLPQLTSGPSSVAFSPDGKSLVYSMAGSLWLQAIDSDSADELTAGPGYDYQPDFSPDGRSLVFARHHADAIELWRLDLASRKTQQLTQTKAVQLQPRISPDGGRLAFVSTAGTGHFNLYVADLTPSGLGTPRAVIAPHESTIPRYYYSAHDHTIDPAWTPDGKGLVFVSNREVAYGTGRICRIVLEAGAAPDCFINEETSWRANPEVAPDGRRVLYSSYQGRQWHQLWVTTLKGEAALPLTFGEFDITQARWSPDGRRVAYISNESGNVALWIREFTGGARKQIVPKVRHYARAMAPLTIKLTADYSNASGRVSVRGSDGRAYAPDAAWVRADDGFDPSTQVEETRYFDCHGECVVNVPLGPTKITAWRGMRYAAAQRTVQVGQTAGVATEISFQPLSLPRWAPVSVSADLHVHMNYGGHYRHTLETLAGQARAEDLDVIYNTVVNKEQRIPDIAYTAGRDYFEYHVTILKAQEYHTSYWGHLGLLDLGDHFLTPDFSAYQQSALTSPYPHNGAVADLAHAQRGLVGYVHPFDWEVVPEKEKSLTNALPVDVALGKVDYIEVVGFSDHKATAHVWHRLLNLGFKLPAGAGTDAMANYASLRGPVGMNRVFLQTGRVAIPQAYHDDLKQGHTFATNGPLLALQVDGRNPGDTLELAPGSHRLNYLAAMRSLAPLDHVEVLYNGRVVARHGKKDATSADLSGSIPVSESGWILLRAWNDDPDPLIFDIYPYASTSPVYVSVGGKPASSREDAEYFLRWIDRVIASADARQDYNDAQEKQDTMDYLRAGRAVFEKKAGR